MEENIMGTLPVGKLLRKMSVPVILSMLVSSLYSVNRKIIKQMPDRANKKEVRLGHNIQTIETIA